MEGHITQTRAYTQRRTYGMYNQTFSANGPRHPFNQFMIKTDSCC